MFTHYSETELYACFLLMWFNFNGENRQNVRNRKQRARALIFCKRLKRFHTIAPVKNQSPVTDNYCDN